MVLMTRQKHYKILFDKITIIAFFSRRPVHLNAYLKLFCFPALKPQCVQKANIYLMSKSSSNSDIGSRGDLTLLNLQG